MNNRVRAPMELMHKRVVNDIASAIDNTYYGASIEAVFYSETIVDGMDIVSTIIIEGANGSHYVAHETNMPEYEMLSWIMYQFLRFLREEAL